MYSMMVKKKVSIATWRNMVRQMTRITFVCFSRVLLLDLPTVIRMYGLTLLCNITVCHTSLSSYVPYLRLSIVAQQFFLIPKEDYANLLMNS